MVLPLKDVAGAKLGRKDFSPKPLAQQTPKNTIGQSGRNPNSYNQSLNGPSFGYSEPKIDKDSIQTINDWQGNSDSKKKEGGNSMIAGSRLTKNTATSQNKSEGQGEEETSKKQQIENTVQNNYQNPAIISEPIRKIAEKKPRLGGVDYAGVMIFVIIKDVLDVFIEILQFVFDATVVMIPIGILLYIISTIADFTILIVTQGYYYFNNVPMTSKKASIQGLTLLIEAFPMIGLLPVGTLSLVMMCKKINKERQLAEEAEQKIYDEQYQKELEEYAEIVKSMNRSSATNTNSISNMRGNVSKKPAQGANQWKDMVDGSNQNITKENPSQKNKN